jgi:hypothetical protein
MIKLLTSKEGMRYFVGWNKNDSISHNLVRMLDDVTLDVICLYVHLR